MWGYLNILSSKAGTKNVTIHKAFELYQISMYNFPDQTVVIFLIYTLFTKIIDTFQFRDVTDVWALA